MAMFTSFKLGELELAHRVVYAPTMRKRVDVETGTLKSYGADYYAQRASSEFPWIVFGSLGR
jgi:2,4-dienoyl-CoA reductase-like NADH-dependent reductase (Old Yellow Enzyme family)